ENRAHVNINGVAVVVVWQGISEGGAGGPQFLPCYMDGLPRASHAAGLGVGLGVRGDMVGTIRSALQEGSQLPPGAALAADPDLEASALLALDRSAPRRLVAIPHADDPEKASPHTKATKHAVLVSGGPAAREAAQSARSLELRLRGEAPVQLGLVQVHKWLGLPWRGDLDLGAMCRMRLAAAAAQVASGDVPLPVAASIFDMKIEGGLRFGRWLWCVGEGSAEAVDEAYQSWARALLGAPPWRTSMVAEAELGWTVSGAGRGVIDVARRRAGPWALQEGDLYRAVFQAAHGWTGLSWASRSLALLASWGVDDWPGWARAHPGEQREAYIADVSSQVSRRCLAEWQARARQHERPVPLLSLCEGPVGDLAIALRAELGWEVLQGMRSISRWRAGLAGGTAGDAVLGHVGGRRSWAAVQSCVLCGARRRSLSFHACSDCPWTQAGRDAFCWGAGRGQQAGPRPSAE
ncbi:unnamed protein product, partial [Prorocentrum cordatum]